jgi:hypothetical protein
LVPSQCNREIKIVCPIDSLLLIVETWAQAKSNSGSPLDARDGHEKAAIELEVVSGDHVDLRGAVRTPRKAISGATGALAADDDDLLPASRPLALHTE